MEPDFSGWVTKYGVKCTDGRTIAHAAFASQAGSTLPLVYQHNHTDVEQVLGDVKLSAKPEGIWGDAFFNESAKAQHAKLAVKAKNLKRLSVWAKNLVENPDYQKQTVMVHDGVMQEVSLVLAGANEGAVITNVLAHSVNGVMLDPDDDLLAVVGEIIHSDVEEPAPVVEDKPVEGGDKTVAEVLGTLNPEQQLAVNAFIDETVTEAVTTAVTEAELQHDNMKGNDMNLFDQLKTLGEQGLPQLKHDDVKAVLIAAKGNPSEGMAGFDEANAAGSLRNFVRSNGGKELMHADDYGVQNMEILFPDAQNAMARPSWVDRRQEWVKTFLGGTSHTPFSRVKTMYADITADEARAKGYIKANEKTEEVFPVFKRVTGPTWVIKMQKLDRQDIIDIVDFDVVAWMKAEMRGKLDEEIARAALFGDGRPTMVDGKINPDKITDPGGANTNGNGIRAIVNDNDLYSTTYNVPMVADARGAVWNALPDAVTEAGEYYLGSGNKTAFISYKSAARMLTIRDDFGHRMYKNLQEIAGDMDVSNIVRVPSELFPEDVLAVVLDLTDYNFGTNRGGEVTLFDDFDIKFNQYLYLIETYLSGALVLPYSAQIFKRVDPAGTLVDDIPRPIVDDNVITIPTVTGVDYKRNDTNAVVAGGTEITLNDTNLKQVEIEAFAKSGFYFDSNVDVKDSFTFRYKAPAS